MNRPEVRAKVSAAHLPVRGRFDPGGKLRRAKHLPGHDFMETGIALPAKPPAQLFDGKGEKRTNILLHAIHTMPPLGRVKPGCTDSQNGQTAHDWGMDKWPQRDRFKAQWSAYVTKPMRDALDALPPV